MSRGSERGQSGMRSAARAKVNLALAVGERRPDDYHDLRSVVILLGLHDDVEVAPADAPHDTLIIDGDPECPVDGNLVLRAAAAVRAAASGPLPGLAFRLRKRIPIGAGLGGGSSDAAAALELAARAWGVTLDPDERSRIAASLGADVPFFASGRAIALVEGLGERLRPLPAPAPPAGVLLVTPRSRLATGAVFAARDRAADPRSLLAHAAVDALVERLVAGLPGPELATEAGRLRDANELWPAAAALAPGLPALRDDLEAVLSRPLLMTGSGSTLVALYPSEAAAAEAARDLTASRPARADGAVITATTTHEEGPG